MEEFFYILQKVKNNRINVEKDKENLENMPDMFKRVCRLCLTESDNLQFSSKIYKQKIKYSDLVENILNMNIVDENEYFHNKVCEDCFSNLTLVFNYKQKCEANYETLLRLNQYMDEVTGKVKEEPVVLVEEIVEDEEIVDEEVLLDVDESADEELNESYEVLDIAKASSKINSVEVGGITFEVTEKEEGNDSEIFEDYEQLEDSDLKVDYEDDNMPEYLWSDNEVEDIKEELESTGGTQDETASRKSGRAKNHICPICHHHVDSPSKLERHMRTHDVNYKGRRPAGAAVDFGEQKKKRIRINKYLCPICMAKFETPNKLKRHMVLHVKKQDTVHTEETFACKYCQCEFPTDEYRRVHEEQHERLKEEKLMKLMEKKVYKRNPILCHICGKYFAKNRSEMTVHLRRHRGEKPYKCEFCEKSFAAGSGLRAHRRIHTGEKPYPCQYCGKLYGDYTSRVKHERRTHTGERPYPCPHCDKAFVCPRVLKHHVMTHTGEKDFVCTECGKGFIKAGNLKVHMNVHLRQQGKPLAYVRPKKVKVDANQQDLDITAYDIKSEQDGEEEAELIIGIV